MASIDRAFLPPCRVQKKKNKTYLTQFRQASNGEVIHGPKRGFSFVACHCGYFFSWSEKFFLSHLLNLHFPITRSSLAFLKKSNIFMLGYRLAEKNGVEALWRREENCLQNLIYITSVVAGVKNRGRREGDVWGGGGGQQLKKKSKEYLVLVNN